MNRIERDIAFPLSRALARTLSWGSVSGPVWSANFVTGAYARNGGAAGLAEVVSVLRGSDAIMAGGDDAYQIFPPDTAAVISGAGLDVYGPFSGLLANGHDLSQSDWSSTVGVQAFVETGETAFGLFRPVRITGSGHFYDRAEQVSDADISAGIPVQVDIFYRAGTSGSLAASFGVNTTAGPSVCDGPVGDLSPGQQNQGAVSIGSDVLLGDGVTRHLTVTYTPNATGKLAFGVGPGTSVSGTNVTILGADAHVGSFNVPFLSYGAPAPVSRDASGISIPDFAGLAAAAGLQNGFRGTDSFLLTRLGGTSSRCLWGRGQDTDNCVKLEVTTADKLRLTIRNAGVDQLVLETADAFMSSGEKTATYVVKDGAISLEAAELTGATSSASLDMPILTNASIGSLFGTTDFFNGTLLASDIDMTG